MEVYIKNNKIYGKGKTNTQNFLHIDSEHPISLKNSIPYSHLLRVRRTCSTIENFNPYCSEIEQKIMRRDTNLAF